MSESLSERMNTVLRARMRPRFSPRSSADVNDFIRGHRRPFVKDAELDGLAALRTDDPARYFALAPDVRERVANYVADREAAGPDEAA